MAVKSTKTLGYALKGIFNKENMTITELDDEDVIVHDLDAYLEKFHDQEISISFNNKVKLENGVE